MTLLFEQTLCISDTRTVRKRMRIRFWYKRAERFSKDFRSMHGRNNKRMEVKKQRGNQTTSPQAECRRKNIGETIKVGREYLDVS